MNDCRFISLFVYGFVAFVVHDVPNHARLDWSGLAAGAVTFVYMLSNMTEQ